MSDIGVAVVQYPGATDEYGGDVSIHVGSVNLVPRVVASVAGSCDAGTGSRMTESLARLQDRHPDDSWIAGRSRDAIRMRELLAAPRSGGGHVKISHGCGTSQTSTPRYLSWIDVRGDGRYVYSRRGEEIRIEPGSDLQFQDGLRQLIGTDQRA